jgi:protein-S-isoprenylcysteine O-methyltransferase Ste14
MLRANWISAFQGVRREKWSRKRSKEGAMPLVTVVIYLVVVGVLLWLVNNYIPMDGKIKQIINILVVVVVIIWLLQVLGVMGPLNRIRVG